MAQIKVGADNLLIGKNLDTAYKSYSAKYDDAARRMKSRGFNMFIEKLTKVEFQAKYAAYANQIEEDTGKVRWGSEKAKLDTIVKSMVDDQRYELSHKQARAYQKYMESEGVYLSLDEIYRDLPEQLKHYNEQLKVQGVVKGEERRALIAAAFFGSD